jgi:hypothetical protein
VSQRRRTDKARKGHQFGGSWTTAKLELIARYLSAYTTALKVKPSSSTHSEKVISMRSRGRVIGTLGEETRSKSPRRDCYFPIWPGKSPRSSSMGPPVWP